MVLCLGSHLSHGHASGLCPLGWEGAFEQAWPHQHKELMERSQLWNVAVPGHGQGQLR